MLKTLTSTIFFIIFVQNVQSIVYNECQLASQLLDHGFPRDQLDNWVCLVESESSGNTQAVGGPNSDGSYDYGLFQINNRYWCSVGYPGGQCNMDCNQFLTDDISLASECAQEIYNVQGFSAWAGWTRNCQNQQLPNIGNDCGF